MARAVMPRSGCSGARAFVALFWSRCPALGGGPLPNIRGAVMSRLPTATNHPGLCRAGDGGGGAAAAVHGPPAPAGHRLAR